MCKWDKVLTIRAEAAETLGKVLIVILSEIQQENYSKKNLANLKYKYKQERTRTSYFEYSKVNGREIYQNIIFTHSWCFLLILYIYFQLAIWSSFLVVFLTSVSGIRDPGLPT